MENRRTLEDMYETAANYMEHVASIRTKQIFKQLKPDDAKPFPKQESLDIPTAVQMIIDCAAKGKKEALLFLIRHSAHISTLAKELEKNTIFTEQYQEKEAKYTEAEKAYRLTRITSDDKNTSIEPLNNDHLSYMFIILTCAAGENPYPPAVEWLSDNAKSLGDLYNFNPGKMTRPLLSSL